MSWIKEQLKRQQQEQAAKRPVSTETMRQDAFVKELPVFWKRLVSTLASDIEAFNSQSERKAVTRVAESHVEILVGKTGALLLVKFDPEKYQVTCSLPGETPKKFKFMMDADGECYMWGEGEGRITFERLSEVLLTPLLFPSTGG